MMNRRSLITGLISLVAAPAIVRAGSLMPVKAMIEAPSVMFGAADWTAPSFRNAILFGQSCFWIASDGEIWEVGTGIYKAADSE